MGAELKIGIILLFLALLVLAFVVERGRSDRLGEVARQLGFSFQRGQQRIPEALDNAGFYLFTQGPPQIQNPMAGNRDGEQVLLFGYAYDAAMGDEGVRELPGSGDDDITEKRRPTVAWFRSTSRSLPDFDLSPAGGPRRSAGRFGLTSMTFDGEDAFRQGYRLLGRDGVAVRQRFTRPVLDFLLANPGLAMESRGHQWLFYRPGNMLKPDDIQTFLAQAEQLLALLSGDAQR